MGLFILTETSAGYALLKARDKHLLEDAELGSRVHAPADISDMFRLKQFAKFESAANALEETALLVEGKVTPMIEGLLDSVKDEKKISLAVADPKLANAIKKLPQLQVKAISDSATNDVFRVIREHLHAIIPSLMPSDVGQMSLGLSHSLSRHKLKFSPDKIDTMIIQAISLLDDLDKELNFYAMRTKEWYGWHFPEMTKIINDNLAYARVVLKVGMRSNASDTDLSAILPEEIEEAIKKASEISMGSDVTDEDMENIRSLAEQVVEFTEYRQQLSSYLGARMKAIAPNLTALVGELVGARLIAKSGSLLNLAKSPASTIQILGAEKALFRALKTKHDTPKYGLIYHASLVGQATGKNKGRIARMLATKTALGLRMDSLADWGTQGEHNQAEPTDEEKAATAVANRLKIERRLRHLEGKPLAPRGVHIGPGGQQAQPSKFELKEARKYNPNADALAVDGSVSGDEAGEKRKLIDDVSGGSTSKKARLSDDDVDMDGDEDVEMGNDEPRGATNGDSDAKASKEERKRIKAERKAAKAAKKARDEGDRASDLEDAADEADAKAEKQRLKAEHEARKAERAAKREAKELKRAAKEAKRAGEENGDAGSKRKHDGLSGDASGHKKKKRTHGD